MYYGFDNRRGFLAQGCGYEEGTDAVVTVVDSTPTPEPTEKPKATATPTPEAAAADSTADGAAADSTTAGAADPAAQTAATEQTPSGINVQAQDATYYAVEGVNLRSDANAEVRVCGRRPFRRIPEVYRCL